MRVFLIFFLLNVSFRLMEFYELLLILKEKLLFNIIFLYNLFINTKIVRILSFRINLCFDMLKVYFNKKKQQKD